MYVSGVQSDLGATEQCHSDTLQVPTATSSCPVSESRSVQEQVMFTSVKVKCEVKVSWCVIDIVATKLLHILKVDLKIMLYMYKNCFMTVILRPSKQVQWVA
jgi:hypothetical protein